ncbi:MAG: hypothetical protein WCW52_07345 [Elusimicrobiales bacterium]|jgi:hypothetical protein
MKKTMFAIATALVAVSGAARAENFVLNTITAKDIHPAILNSGCADPASAVEVEVKQAYLTTLVGEWRGGVELMDWKPGQDETVVFSLLCKEIKQSGDGTALKMAKADLKKSVAGVTLLLHNADRQLLNYHSFDPVAYHPNMSADEAWTKNYKSALKEREELKRQLARTETLLEAVKERIQ